MIPRFELVDEPYQLYVRDVNNQLNLFVVAESGMGVTSGARRLAERTVDFLNSLPPQDAMIYHFCK